MSNPYLINGPALISFSGGRTSAFMLWQILLAHGGELPPDVIVTFANTGKEQPETLDFVRDCGEHWGVRIVWLEYDPTEERKFKIVDYATASRNGEPFKALIRKRAFLPNPVMRFCTAELKVRTMARYGHSLGWIEFDKAVGLRADEMGRVKKVRNDGNPSLAKGERNIYLPLADAGVAEHDVLDFWDRQNFNLQLASFEGNCDLCFLKGQSRIIRIMQERPNSGAWWAEAEAEAEVTTMDRGGKAGDATFRKDRPSYSQLIQFAQSQGRFEFDVSDITEPCGTECLPVDA